ncbi:MAG TPA: PIN domain-containing protein [Bacteroidetes bacterium]|nr:PIN domain-containing protein [Bacteroidota bacterium]HEX05227.1 PIN domain-containing protein [Bacteroidota bacterium]
MRRFVVDASVALKAYFPDEEGHQQAQAVIRDYVMDHTELLVPPLFQPEIANGVLVAVRMGRISEELAYEILSQIENLNIPIATPPSPQEICRLAIEYGRSAYDATYLSLLDDTSFLVTGDKKLYNAIKDRMTKVVWIEEYRGKAEAS